MSTKQTIMSHLNSLNTKQRPRHSHYYGKNISSNSHQFHKYYTKRTVTSHLNWNHWTQKREPHMTLEIQVLAWDRHTHVVGLNRLLRSEHSLLANGISYGNTYNIQYIVVFVFTKFIYFNLPFQIMWWCHFRSRILVERRDHCLVCHTN